MSFNVIITFNVIIAFNAIITFNVIMSLRRVMLCPCVIMPLCHYAIVISKVIRLCPYDIMA